MNTVVWGAGVFVSWPATQRAASAMGQGPLLRKRANGHSHLGLRAASAMGPGPLLGKRANGHSRLGQRATSAIGPGPLLGGKCANGYSHLGQRVALAMGPGPLLGKRANGHSRLWVLVYLCLGQRLKGRRQLWAQVHYWEGNAQMDTVVWGKERRQLWAQVPATSHPPLLEVAQMNTVVWGAGVFVSWPATQRAASAMGQGPLLRKCANGHSRLGQRTASACGPGPLDGGARARRYSR